MLSDALEKVRIREANQAAKRKPAKGPLSGKTPDFKARRAAMEAAQGQPLDLSAAASTFQSLGLSLAFFGVVVAYKLTYLSS